MQPSPMADTLADALRRAVDASGAGSVALAVSGGRDSTLLLHLAAGALAGHRAAGRLRVLHVDHGRLPERHLWQRSVQDWSARRGLMAHVLTVTEPVPRGASPEAWLRQQRYRLLEDTLLPGEALITAHHLDDQAETFLLQGLRGCGPAGLAGMPERAALGPGLLLRPWLRFTRKEISRAAMEMAVEGFDDPSNADVAFDRNFLRHEVMPVLETRWPSVARSLGRSVRWQAEAAAALDEAARALLPSVSEPADEGPPRLSLPRLSQYAPPLRRVLLRTWLLACGAQPPGARHIEAIERLLDARQDAQGEVCWAGVRLRRHRDCLFLEQRTPDLPGGDGGGERRWLPPDVLELPHGRLMAHLGRSGAQRLALSRTPCVVGWRNGGERIRPAGDRHTRSLKVLLQRAAVPPWQRARQPLLYRDGLLVAVAGLCVADAAAARAGEPGWVLEWRPGSQWRGA